MKNAFAALLALLLLACAPLSAQKVGDAWTDRRGIVAQYNEKHFCNLRLEDHRLQMVFFTDEGIVEAPPFAKVIVHMDPRNRNKAEMTFVLKPSADGAAMESARALKPPYNYSAIIVLVPQEAGDDSEDAGGGKIVIPESAFHW